MNDDAFDALVEESFQLAEMAKHPGWRILNERLEKSADAIRARVLGGALNEETYKSLTGELQGIERALVVPRRVNEELERARERRGS